MSFQGGQVSTLVVGIGHMGDAATVGRVGAKTMGWFVSASIVSLLLGLLMVNLLQPGVGIVIADHRGGADDKRLQKLHNKLLYASGFNISTYTNLVEGLFLQQSNLSVGIQLADMVAGAVWRHYERGDSHWFNMVAPTLRTDRGGKTAGFGIIKVPKIGWV